MENPFIYTYSNKRYHTFDYYLKNKYQSKVFKISLDAGFTCPNRDGKIAKGGCYFCSSQGAGEFAGDRNESLQVQFEKVKAMMHKKWPIAKYIAYFQAFSNTYASVEVLKNTFEIFVNKPNVVGIAIATRPDCLDTEILNYLEDLNSRCDLTIELGLQTIHDQSAIFFNRGYLFETFVKSYSELVKRNIKVLVHLINGLPYETANMMIETARVIGRLKPWGIKIHSLYVLNNTVFGQIFIKNPFPILSKDEYIEIVVKQLELLPQNCVIERLTGDGVVADLIEPKWAIKKVTLLNDIDKYMLTHNTYQGRCYHE